MSEVFIQWKGTDACLDIRCACGEVSHYDGFFAYAVKCPHCGKCWEMPTILAIKTIDDDSHAVMAEKD